MQYRYRKYIHLAIGCLLWVAGIIIIQACSKSNDDAQGKDSVAVPFTVGANQSNRLLASFNNTSSVNRILLLPFKKINEAATNDDVNFIPDFTAAKQFDVNDFPAFGTLMVNLAANTSYKVMVLGYNRTNYDFNNPTGAQFTINSASNPTQLDNAQLSLTLPVIVPEFFSCICNATLNSTSIGAVFTVQPGVQLTGELKRIVSGLSLEVTNIPAYVDSVTLVAEQLVTATKAKDGTPTVWQTAGDTGYKQLAKQAPVSGKISFNNYILPTLDAHKTKLFLDIHYGQFTERYTVKVNDLAGVSSTNSITFTPNQAVNITGDYSNINIGFTINTNIGLDDDTWDGLQ